ncbi:MAG: DUF4268 domain-containing protein [Chloroflexota bacterium]
MTGILGNLRPVQLREVWPREAADFTPWLAENLAALGDAVGMDLELVQTEAPVGAFALDVLASDVSSGRKVAIENQLETTNHEHLGQLLTYASGYEADVVIWIASNLREEHRQALDWLNERTDSTTDFFGIVVEAFRIDDSAPAYRFNLVARPNEWRKANMATAAGVNLTGRQEAYRAFFQSLIDRLRDEHRFTNARVAQGKNWHDFASGFGGIRCRAAFNQGGMFSAQIYIDTGVYEDNKRLFDALLEHRHMVEERFQDPVTWERLDNNRASRIAIYHYGAVDDAPERVAAYQDWLVETLLKLKSVVSPLIRDAIEGSEAGTPMRSTTEEEPYQADSGQ